MSVKDIKDKLEPLINNIFLNVPSGVGSRRKDFKLSKGDLKKVLEKGALWAVEQGFGNRDDLEFIEDQGNITFASADDVSDRAYERGKDQLGTLGSGNHFIEIGYVQEIYQPEVANTFGLFKEQITIMIHTGSRGLGYQVCDDYIKEMIKVSERYGIDLPDRQLCCAPVSSPEGERYLRAMAAAANYAFVNRQMIGHWVRETFERFFNMGSKKLGLDLVYDVCHNIAKIEWHKDKKLCVHRKGATRAYPPGHKMLPEKYRTTGQPVFIPGDMGRASYVLAGTERAMEETFGSTSHGAGRVMSRNEAIKAIKGRSVLQEMGSRGIIVRAASKMTLVEEIPEAYKDVSKVVRVVHDAGISRLVAKIVPIGVIKG